MSKVATDARQGKSRKTKGKKERDEQPKFVKSAEEAIGSWIGFWNLSGLRSPDYGERYDYTVVRVLQAGSQEFVGIDGRSGEAIEERIGPNAQFATGDLHLVRQVHVAGDWEPVTDCNWPCEPSDGEPMGEPIPYVFAQGIADALNCAERLRRAAGLPRGPWFMLVAAKGGDA